MLQKRGILLINLGTPDAPTTAALRPYLRQFLSDPRVIDLPRIFRWLLVNLIIVPFRSAKSAAMYTRIWHARDGSPLLTHGKSLVAKLSEVLKTRGEPQTEVLLAMRYGGPSVSEALENFSKAGVDDIVVFPLFPQYSSAAYGSAVAETYQKASERWNVPRLKVVAPYFDNPKYLNVVAKIALEALAGKSFDHLLFSYHGLPMRHCQKSINSQSFSCTGGQCCEVRSVENRNCYRAQCVETSKKLATLLALRPGQWESVFQSRFGRDEWTSPSLDQRVVALAQAGIRTVAVITPSFTADCLETLEEIGERAAHSFRQHGGSDLILVPCLNADQRWAAAVAELVAPERGPSKPW